MRHLITGKNAVKYLINSALLKEGLLYDSLLNGKLAVREVFGESRNIVLLIKPDPSVHTNNFVIKQVQKADAGKIQSLANEANFLKNFYTDRFIDYDSESHILVYKTKNSYVSFDINRFSTEETFGYTLGEALRRFSQLEKRGKDFSSLGLKKKGFRILEDWPLYKSQVQLKADLSVLECMAFIDEHYCAIESIRERWGVIPEGLVHGDVRPGNFLVDEEDQWLHLIDFELSGVCNPIYDLSSFLFNTYRMLDVDFQNLPLPGVSPGNLKNAIRGMFEKFSELHGIKYKDIVKDAFSFYSIKLIENYINGTVKRSWSWNQQSIEYRAVLKYRKIISEYDSMDFEQQYVE